MDGDAAPTPKGSQRKSGSWHGWRLVRRTLRGTITVLLIVLVVELVVLPEIAGPRNALHLLGETNIWLLIAGFVAEGASLFAYTLLTRAVLPQGGPRLWTLERINLSTLAVSHVLPGGSLGGAGLGYRLLSENGVRGADAGVAMATEGAGSALVLNAILWVALLVSLPFQGIHPLYLTGAIVGIILFTSVGLLLGLIVRGERRAERWLRAVAVRLPRVDPDRVVQAANRAARRLRELGSDRRLLGRATGFAALNWLLDAASLWFFLVAFLHRLPNPITLLVAYGLANVLAAIPITPGGLGVIETVLPLALVGFGIPKGPATLGVLAWRLVNFWLPIPVGGAAYISLRVGPGASRERKMRELERIATTPSLERTAD